jgi:hypothetical protein
MHPSLSRLLSLHFALVDLRSIIAGRVKLLPNPHEKRWHTHGWLARRLTSPAFAQPGRWDQSFHSSTLRKTPIGGVFFFVAKVKADNI